MASKNQVTLTLAGDASKLESAFDDVGASAKGMADKVDSASGDMSSSFDRVGGATDSLDDKAGGLEQTTRGTMDVMSGLGELSQGNVLQGVTDLGGGVSSLAQGLGTILVPAMQKTVGWLAQTRVGMLAQAAASKVVAGATKVWTGIQAAFNLVMSLNPIVLVVIAIVALVAIIIIAYQRSETFRKIVDAAFRAVGAVVSWLGDRFQDWWAGIQKIIGFLVGAFQRIAPRLRSAFSGLFRIITAPFRAAFNFVARAWNNTIGRLSWSIPSWVPGIGGNSISAPRLPQFHQGGVASGAMGREFLAVLRAGERVTPAGGGPASVRVGVERGGGGTSVEQSVADLVLHLVRTGALALHVREGQVVV